MVEGERPKCLSESEICSVSSEDVREGQQAVRKREGGREDGKTHAQGWLEHVKQLRVHRLRSHSPFCLCQQRLRHGGEDVKSRSDLMTGKVSGFVTTKDSKGRTLLASTNEKSTAARSASPDACAGSWEAATSRVRREAALERGEKRARWTVVER